MNLAIVNLMLDLEPRTDPDPRNWAHLDGRPMDDQERDLVGRATWEELCVVRAHLAQDLDRLHADDN